MTQKIKPGTLESHVHDLERTEFEKRLIKKLGEMYDYGNVSQGTIEREANALHVEMPEVKFARSQVKFEKILNERLIHQIQFTRAEKVTTIAKLCEETSKKSCGVMLEQNNKNPRFEPEVKDDRN